MGGELKKYAEYVTYNTYLKTVHLKHYEFQVPPK